MKLLAKDLNPIVYFNGAVSLTFDCGYEVKEELRQLPRGDYVISVNKVGKRSLNQNALLWELIGMIGMKENGNRNSDIQIYVNILRAAGVKVVTVTIPRDEYDHFCRTSNYRAVDIVHSHQNSTGREFVTCYCYVGSSHMDSAEMSAVIDTAIDYAREIGLSTDLFEEEFKKARTE